MNLFSGKRLCQQDFEQFCGDQSRSVQDYRNARENDISLSLSTRCRTKSLQTMQSGRLFCNALPKAYRSYELFLQNQLQLEPAFLLSGFRAPRALGLSFIDSSWLQIWTYFDMIPFATLYDWISCHRRRLLSSGDKLARSPLFFFNAVTCQLLLGRIQALSVCVVRICSRYERSIRHGVGVLETFGPSSSGK